MSPRPPPTPLFCLPALLGLFPGAAAAAHLEPVAGEVVSAESRWAGDRILTESVIRTEGGERITLSQLGGAVDGIAMVVSHHPPPLRPGQLVRGTAAVREGPDGEELRVLRSLEPAPVPTSSHEGEFAVYGVVRAGGEVPVHWRSGCVEIWLDAAGTETIEGDRELEVVREAFDTWASEVSSTCSELSFALLEVEGVEVGDPVVNYVTFRDDRWCRPTDGSEPEMCYNPAALAVTTTFLVSDPDSPRFGEIVSAEIEINSANVPFGVSGAPDAIDLKSTLTHEIGHLLGLAHNCWSDEAIQPRDHAGRPVPPCDSVPPELSPEEATMYFSQEPGETRKATLHGNDIVGACAILRDRDCEWEARSEFEPFGGCAAAPRGGAASSLLPLLFSLALFLRTRAPRGRRAPGVDGAGGRGG